MTCKDVASFLMDYLEGELADASRRVFDEHLAECPDCVAYIEGYQNTIRLSKDAAAEQIDDEVPEPLIEAILAARKRGS